MTRTPGLTLTRLAAGLLLLATVSGHTALAQRGGGGGGGGAEAPMVIEFSRLESIAQTFKLTKDQKSKVKATLDQAHTAAAPVRDQLAKTRAALSTAIQAGKPQADLDSAIKDYAAQVTAMTTIETDAFAETMKTFTAEQRTNAAGVQTMFFMFRGMFTEKKWDVVANGFYGY